MASTSPEAGVDGGAAEIPADTPVAEAPAPADADTVTVEVVVEEDTNSAAAKEAQQESEADGSEDNAGGDGDGGAESADNDADDKTSSSDGAKGLDLDAKVAAIIRENQLSPRQILLRRVAAVVAFLVVLSLSISLPLALMDRSTVRRYYIAAEDVEWNYAPAGRDMCAGHDFTYPATKFTSTRVANTSDFNNRIGTTYSKARFIGYTDATFTVREERAAGSEWEHLGILGPVVRAEVGDIIEVVFRNRARFPFSMSVSGVGISKASEGSRYADGSWWGKHLIDDFLPAFGLSVSTCDGFSRLTGCRPYKVRPGNQWTYRWTVPERAGPGSGPNQPSSTVWLYRSNHDDHGEEDLNAGLIGPIIITRRGESTSATQLRPRDVDREFVVALHATDENLSPYFKSNVFDHITKLALGNTRIGQVPFGPFDRATVLQALVSHATSGLSKISRSAAVQLVADANAAHEPVGYVNGASIHVRFDRDSFDPSSYDAANGGFGTARRVVEDLAATLVDDMDPGFIESNMMHMINGYLYCNQPGLTMAVGERVRWYTIVVGGGVDIHTPHWHGNTLLLNGHRHDEYEMLPGSVATTTMVPDSPGTWLFHCHVNDHLKGGMESLYTVTGTQPDLGTSAGTVREYFIAAEEVDWDYLPGGVDACDVATGGDGVLAAGSRAALTLGPAGTDRVGGRSVRKATYVQYTDATFTTQVPKPDHLGILGPVLRAEVGDTIRVTFKNNASHDFSMHPHGVFYGKGAEGFSYADGSGPGEAGDDSVAPGSTYTYEWPVPERAGPGPADPSSKIWMYHSHVSETNDTNAGLIGPLVVTRAGMATSSTDLTPSDVADERFLLFMALDESKSRYAAENIASNVATVSGARGATTSLASLGTAARAAAVDALRREKYFKKYSLRHSVNGRALCTLGGMDNIPADGTTRFHLMSLGDEVDLHTPTFGGHSVTSDGRQTASVPLMAGSMVSVDLVARRGSWGLDDLVTEHYDGGARVRFTAVGGASPSDATANPRGTREYFVAADEIEWEYAPDGINMCSGENFEDDEFSHLYTEQGHHRVGTRYVKAIYREYDSANFDYVRWGPESRFNPASAHLGLLGPVMKAEARDRIRIVFRNNLRANASLVPLGGGLEVTSVKALNDAQRAAGGPRVDHVVPGGEVEILIFVHPEAAPGADEDTNSVAYLYGSDVDLTRDLNTGLIGAFIILKEGASGRVGTPHGVHREFLALFTTFDENLSRYARHNVLRYAEDGETVDTSEEWFRESNRMHSINGFIFCNGPGAQIKQHQVARWYMMAAGSSHDLHGPHISGYTYSSADAQHKVVLLEPGVTRAVDVIAEGAGKWLVRDDVVTNQRAGSAMFFDVTAVLHPGA